MGFEGTHLRIICILSSPCQMLSADPFLEAWVPVSGVQYSSRTDTSPEAGPPEKCSLGVSVSHSLPIHISWGPSTPPARAI